MTDFSPTVAAARPGNFFARRLSFGVGSLGLGVFSMVPGVLLLYYLTTVVHVQPAFAGLAVLTPKLVSVFTDPIVGHLSDRLKMRSEMHRRAFMLIGALSIGLGLWAVFTLPTRLPNGGWVAAAIYFVCVLTFSCFQVPYVSLPADIEEAPDKRRALIATRMMFAFAGALIGTSTGPTIAGALGYPTMGLALGAFAGAAIALSVLTYSKGVSPAPARPRERLSLSGLRDGRFLMSILAIVLLVVATSGSNAALPFLVQGVFKQPGSTLGKIFLLGGATGVVATLIWPLILKRLPAQWSWPIAVSLMILGSSCVVLAGAPNGVLIAGLVSSGIGFAGAQVIAYSALAEMAGHAESAGRSGAGVMTGLWLAGEKIAFAFGPMLVGLVMQFAVQPGGSKMTALQIALGVLPVLLALIAILIFALRPPLRLASAG